MNVGPTNRPSQRRYRRRILGWGAVGLLGVFSGGAAIFANRVEDDLERRVTAVLDGQLSAPVSVQFRGQDGTLFCDVDPVDFPTDVLRNARDVWGVRQLRVDNGCSISAGAPGGPDGSEDPSTTQADGSEADDAALDGSGTVLDVIGNDSQFSILEGLIVDAGIGDQLTGEPVVTVFAPTNSAFEVLGPDVVTQLQDNPALLTAVLTHHITDGALDATDLVDGALAMSDGSPVTVAVGDVITLTTGPVTATVSEADVPASNGVVHAIDRVLVPDGVELGNTGVAPISVVLAGGQLTLSGDVATDDQRRLLVDAASTQLAEANVIDELRIDPQADHSESQIADVATVVAAMVPNLAEGTITLGDDGVAIEGVVVSDESRAALEAVFATVDDFEVSLSERPTADEADATALAADLNRLVTANPLQFEPGSIEISDESAAVLDRLAAFANRIDGIDIEVQGHTDTDGLAGTNQTLSEGRASAVVLALVQRGVAFVDLRARGFGGSQPVVNAAGVEDKAASRRVEFVVTTAP